MTKEKEPILYLDDEEANLLAFRMTFGKNYNIFLANNASEAITILNENKIKLVISDQRMPDITGLEFIAQQKEKFPDVIWMILTAYVDLEITMQAINQGGVYQFLSKPWKVDEMTITINNAIEKFNLKQQNINLLAELKEKNTELESYNEELITTTNSLKESEEKFRSLIEKSPIATAITDFDENIEYLNDKFVKTFGYTIEDIPNVKDWWPLAYPDEEYRNETKDEWYTKVEDSLNQQKEIIPIEGKVKCKKGDIKYIEIKGTQVGNKFLVTFNDLTERKKAEEALQKEKEFIEKVIDKLPGLFFLYKFDEIPKLIRWNKNHETITGYSNEELINKSALDFSNEKEKEIMIQTLSELKDKGEATIETNLLTKNGKEIPFFLNGTTFIDNEENYFFGFGINISERRKAEKALVDSEKKFRNIFNSSTDGILIADLNQNILAFNNTLSTMFGFEEKQALEKKVTDFILPKDISQIQERVKQMTKNKAVSPLEIEVFNISGESFPIEVSSKIIDFDNKKAVLSILRNITERKEAERKILNAVIETEERERERFAKDLHDGIGPLLSASKIYSKALQVSETEEERNFTIRKMEETIDEAILSAQEISNNISPHVLKNFGLGTAIESFYTKIRSTSKIIFNLSSKLDKRLNEKIEISLYRITVELIHNTIKHAKAKKINIQLNKENNVLHFSYKDDGKGFDINQTLSKSKGMGLSNIESRIRSLDGIINMTSGTNTGFKVEIHVGL